ncbi:MAG: ABC transporter substrate-binding protein [Streptosporangiaceae bacterium]|nr:ABC transporter substrate-binding protein [Streptosporangiaceae bacterium]
MNTRKFRAAPLIAAVTVSMVAGCSAASGGSAGGSLPSKLESPQVTVAALPAADLAGLYAALSQGLFAQQGLNVTIEKISSSAAVVAAQLRGQVDIAAGAYVAYISAQAAGARFRILAEASTLQPHTRVLVTNAASPITTVADLAGKKIGVNGTRSIGTLLISALLQEDGISPTKVKFVTDKQGFPAMPGHLQEGDYDAAFLSEPYLTLAEEDYGDQVLADFDQGSLSDLPIDGYIATQAWVQKHPKTAAAFVRAIEEGQTLANTDGSVVRAALGKYDNLPPWVTAVMALPQFPTGPVVAKRIQREAVDMLDFGMLSTQYATEVERGTLVASMLGPGS